MSLHQSTLLDAVPAANSAQKWPFTISQGLGDYNMQLDLVEVYVCGQKKCRAVNFKCRQKVN